jgi:hypothetical protein
MKACKSPCCATMPASFSTALALPGVLDARCTLGQCRPAKTSCDGSPKCAGRCRCAEKTAPTHTAGSPQRRDWGDGGAEFHWWCTDTPDAFVGKKAVWQSMKNEIIEMTSPAAYELLQEYMKGRKKAGSVPLPHPAVRRRPSK